ncbi:MAG: AAA family ATPase, partial [Halobacteriota archaeon]|nr:AAA family ATPase [Halobacteriota archaeon]
MGDLKEITLRVAEAYHRDAGRGIARIDINSMKSLGMVSGDIIEITGKNTATAIVWPGYADDNGKGVIRIDGNIRNNANVAIDDRVRVRKVEAKEAKKVTIAPTQPVRVVGGEHYLLKILEGRPVINGQKIRVEMLGNPLTFIITSTMPSGTVIVTKNTKVNLKEKALEEEKRNVPQVTYEDIGGLKRE